MKRRLTRSLTTPVACALATALVWGCAEQVDPTSALEGPIAPTVLQRDLDMVIGVQERHTPQLMRVPNVVGTAVSIGADGEPVVTVLAKNTSQIGVPDQLEGVPVEVMLTGEFYATPPIVPRAPKCGTPPCGGGGGGGGGEVDPTARFDRPVPIGVSTGHPAITAGTLGVRVKAGLNVFALSNNHVYADENSANNGDAVIQPGTFDGGSSPADDIGNLFAYQTIIFGGPGCPNTIDAAIAATTTGDVGNSTPSDGYGTPKSTTVSPTEGLGKKVKKYGRTTGQTTGSIGAINASVNVGYSTGTACFSGQLVITPGSFSAGGDSGSLIVMDGKGRDKSLNNRPVGLLFAGSIFQTIANPIDPVLTRFNVTIDGN